MGSKSRSVKPRPPARLAGLALLLVLALGLTACSSPSAAGGELERQNQELRRRVTELEQRLRAAQSQEQTITIYRMETTSTEFWLVPVLKQVPRRPDPLKAALEELIKEPSLPIPKETRVLDVEVKDFIAYPNFSAEITRLSVGSGGEALVVAAIANTLIKFPGVERVQILVEGKKVESLAGHVDLSQPVGRNDAVVRLEGDSRVP
ncbi:MAG: GerMN domain-containing protein [Moorellales bacterium]